jgi:AAA ATPase domain
MGPGTVGALVGRVQERDELAAALVSLRGGSGGVLVIEGEPGIGKTRLLVELAHLAGGEDCAVLSARASELERDLPYALWSEAIGPYLAGLGERRVRLLGLLDPQALAGLAPGMLAGSWPGNDPGGSPAADRHRVHRALRDLLGRLAASRALVICLDDVHWADPASLEAAYLEDHSSRPLPAAGVRGGHRVSPWVLSWADGQSRPRRRVGARLRAAAAAAATKAILTEFLTAAPHSR